ncbi:MAG: hypothetical protein RML56_05670 [Burkholderiales bacterium]|nr:hypothetical protein [Burkholderiales bacterium]
MSTASPRAETVAAPRAAEAPPAFFAVGRRRRETADVVTFELPLAADAGDFVFAPGQFNMLSVFGVGEIPVSISGDPANRRTIVHTVRAVGAVSRALFEARTGTPIGLRGPFGRGWPTEEAKGYDVLLVAGGLGLAPLQARALPVARRARALRAPGARLRRARARAASLSPGA